MADHVHRLHAIASCYVGDVASRKKKSAIQPTLLVHLRPENLSYPSSLRSFRRRSQDALPKSESTRRDSTSSSSTLMFRPPQDDPNSLERWAREIQSRLMSGRTSLSRTNTVGVESAFREKFQGSDYDSPVPSPSSLFLVNGEPSTALLSPSIRSRASNLSSIDSDDKLSLLSSSASEIASPRSTEDKRSPSALSDQLRPSFSLPAELYEAIIDHPSTDLTPVSSRGPRDVVLNLVEPHPKRRETILDRFFSTTATNVPEPVEKSSSIARFEALMREMEDRDNKIAENPSLPVMMRDSPRRIPSPTQRALEFVMTGHRSRSPASAGDESRSSARALAAPNHNHHAGLTPGSSRRSSAAAPLAAPPARILLDRRHSDELSERTSDSRNSMTESSANVVLHPTNHSKRHSLADFSIMRLNGTPSMYVAAGGGAEGRRGSYGDIRGGEAAAAAGRASTETTTSAQFGDGEFGSHTAMTSRPLFREFSF